MAVEFTLIIWNNPTTPRLACQIVDPNHEQGWLPKYIYKDERHQMPALVERIRGKILEGGRFWFMKPLTVTTQFLTNAYVTKQKLALVSIEYFYKNYNAHSLHFENALISTMEPFTVLKEFRDSDDSGMYHSVSMSVEKVVSYQGRDAIRHSHFMEKWHSS